jgi:hypothetical protein
MYLTFHRRREVNPKQPTSLHNPHRFFRSFQVRYSICLGPVWYVTNDRMTRTGSEPWFGHTPGAGGFCRPRASSYAATSKISAGASTATGDAFRGCSEGSQRTPSGSGGSIARHRGSSDRRGLGERTGHETTAGGRPFLRPLLRYEARLSPLCVSDPPGRVRCIRSNGSKVHRHQRSIEVGRFPGRRAPRSRQPGASGGPGMRVHDGCHHLARLAARPRKLRSQRERRTGCGCFVARLLGTVEATLKPRAA